MQNTPINTDHYKLRVVEAPVLKMKRTMEKGVVVSEKPATGPNGEAHYEAVLYIRAREAGDYGDKDSEEIKVTLLSPCDDIEEDDVVRLVEPKMSTYSFITDKGKKVNGVSYKAEGLTKVG